MEVVAERCLIYYTEPKKVLCSVIVPPSFPHLASEDKSDSISSDDELAFSSDEEDGLATTAVDHYESLVGL